MLKVLRFLKNVYLLGRRLSKEELRQKNEQYSIKFEQFGPERSITYSEGGRDIDVIADFTWSNDVVLFTDSIRNWSRPTIEELSDFDFQKVLNRVIRYFSCWGEVTLDESKLQTLDEAKVGLERDGIPYEELPGGVVRYSINIEKEKNRKGGFFDR